MRILAINPGSTSTKIAVYEDETPVFTHSISHPADEVLAYEHIPDQLPMRMRLIKETLAQAGQPLRFDAVIGRGSLAKPVEGGVYEVSQAMIDDAWHAKHQHACDLGCILAHDLAREAGCKSYTADPGVVDELNDYARISGSPHCPRICIWHALNQRAIARRYARETGTRYEDLNLIVAHLGGGISVAAHDHGRAVDTNNALDGEGPFSPERAGSLPANELVRLCYSGRYTQAQLLKRIAGKAGLTAHLGTNNMQEILQRIADGDEKARLVVDAMCYHIAKAIAAEGAVLCGRVDAILITGGLAYADYIIERIRPRIEFLAPVHIYPGENEMEALALNALSVLRGEVQPKPY